jgi:hypothetical protein
MSVVDFLKTVGGVTLPEQVIERAKQVAQDQREKAEERKKEEAPPSARGK